MNDKKTESYLSEGSLKIGKYIGNLLDTWARNYLEVFNKLDISQVSAAEYKQILYRPFESVMLKRTN